METTTISDKLSLKNNRKFKIFLFFLLITSVIWFMLKLSKTYTSTAIFSVKYENLPSDKLLQNSPVTELGLSVKATGFSLLKYKIKKHTIAFDLGSVIKKNRDYYLLPNAQLQNLSRQLSSGAEVVQVLQDTIFIELGSNISKKVPVNTNLDIKFKLGYNLIEPLRILPDSILIIGPEKEVNLISEINTKPIKLTEVYEDVALTLEVINPLESNHLELATTKIKATGKVDRFTEGFFNIPVKIINEPEGVQMNPFPKEIKVVYQVGLSHFNKINENSFSVVFDYQQYQKDTTIQYLTPVIIHQSEYLHSLKLNPSQIEFLIQK